MYNQPPLWIINSTLFALFIGMLFFVGLSRYKLPARTQLKVEYAPEQSPKDVSKIDTSRIYRNDLFNTFHGESAEAPTKPVEKKLQLPTPPIAKAAAPVEQKPVQFLEPLAITLKGIMFSTEEQHNRVIIQDAKSGAEKLYKVGDMLEDAEIVRIYYNKVMIIRSNGQQETLFVTAQEAQKDISFKHDIEWKDIIIKKSPTEFAIHKDQFTYAIKNLAQFIDVLDITTAFKKGKVIGCRIGVLKPQTVGPALGLEPNDIILTIAGIETTSTNDRVEIFTKIKNMNPEEQIEVTLLRNGNPLTHTYSFTTETNGVPHHEPTSAPDNKLPQELQNMHEMSTKLAQEAQTNKNPMLASMHQDNLTAMTTSVSSTSVVPASTGTENAPETSSPLLQQVPT